MKKNSLIIFFAVFSLLLMFLSLAYAEPAEKAAKEGMIEVEKEGSSHKDAVTSKSEESSAKDTLADRDENKPEVSQEVKEEERKKVPAKKNAAKVSKEEGSSKKVYTGRKISLDFQDADINNVLRLLSEVSGLNIISSEDVKGKVSIRVVDVPWDQALDVILKTKELGKEREGNIIRIATLERLNKEKEASLRARAKQAEEMLKEKETQKKLEPLETEVFHMSYADVKDMQESIKKILSERGDITVDERTNTMIVKDTDKNLIEVADLVKILDKQTPQVMIEARIVQTEKNYGRELGIRWGGFFERNDFQINPNAHQQTGGQQIAVNADDEAPLNFGALGGVSADPNTHTPGGGNFVVSLPAGSDTAVTGAIGAIGFGIGNIFNDLARLDIELSAAELNGKAKILSTPKISALDNKEAYILTGERIPFSTVSDSGTETQFIDAVISLTVTPHITPDNFISMKIKATKDSRGSNVPQAGGGSQPIVDKTEVHTEVLVKDGDTTVIGGIFEKTRKNQIDGIPFLKDIPALGWLFKRKFVQDDNDELLIFLTPKITKRKKL